MIVYKNFLRIVRTKKITVILYSAVFLVTSFMFSVRTSGGISDFKENTLTLDVVDNDNSDLSKALIEYLKTKHTVSVIKDAQNEDSEEVLRKIKKEISLGNADAGIIINKGLEENMAIGTDCITSLTDNRKPASVYADMQIQKFLLFAESVKKAEGSFNFEKIQKALKEETAVYKITARANTGVNVWFKYFFNIFAWFSFSMIFNVIGWAIFLLKKPIIKLRNDVSPVSTVRFSLEAFAAQLTVVLVLLFFVIGAAVVLRINHLAGVPLSAYILNCCIYAAVVLSITFLLNAVLKKGTVLGILGTVLPLSLAFISGVFVPAEYISPVILKISQLFPTYYFVQANEFAYTFLKVDWRNETAQLLFFALYLAAGIYFTMRSRSQNKIDAEQK